MSDMLLSKFTILISLVITTHSLWALKECIVSTTARIKLYGSFIAAGPLCRGSLLLRPVLTAVLSQQEGVRMGRGARG